MDREAFMRGYQVGAEWKQDLSQLKGAEFDKVFGLK